MRYLTSAIFLTLIMGFVGCGDKSDTGGEVDAGDGAAAEMTMEGASAEGAAMDEGSSDAPAWTVLEQNVVHSE